MNRRQLMALGLTLLIAFAAATRSQTNATSGGSTFFMGRVQYSRNNGRDCSSVGKDLVRLVANVSTLQVQEERLISIQDPELFETPFLFMNGHDDFALSTVEISNLREYFVHGGFLLASGCCTYPGFPPAWRREFSRIFSPQALVKLPYSHPIYRTFSKVTTVRCLHEPRDIFLEGLYYRNRLVAVMCPDGLCCSFSMNNMCNRNKGVSPEDGKKLALNIAVYALTH